MEDRERVKETGKQRRIPGASRVCVVFRMNLLAGKMAPSGKNVLCKQVDSSADASAGLLKEILGLTDLIIIMVIIAINKIMSLSRKLYFFF